MDSTSCPSDKAIQTKSSCSEFSKAKPRIRIIVADDHAVFRKCLIQYLNDYPELDVIAGAKDGEEAVEMTIHLRPDVVIMDMEMPRMNGIEATRKIKSLLPAIRIIGVSMHPYGEMEHRILAAGAKQYFAKSDPVEDLVEAIQR